MHADHNLQIKGMKMEETVCCRRHQHLQHLQPLWVDLGHYKTRFSQMFFFSGTLGDLWNLSYFGQIKFCHVHQHYLVSVHVFVPSLPFDGDCQPLSHFPIPQGSLLILPRLPTNCCRTCFSVCRMVCRQTHMNMHV